jgi:hypothetical protein
MLVPGIENADGEPLIVVATGSRRRPLLQAFGSIAAALTAGARIG